MIVAISTEATIEQGAAAAAAQLLAELPSLPSLQPGASIEEARAWQLEKHRRAALERVAAGLTVDAGRAHLPAEITAVLVDVAEGEPGPETRPLNHDARRELRTNHEQRRYSPLFIISGGYTSGREGETGEQAGAPLPAGNGLSWAMRNALKAIHEARPRDGKQPPPAGAPLLGAIAVSGVVIEAPALAPVIPGVKTYPSLNTAVLKAGKAPLYRIWLYARHLDPAGRGWVQVAELRLALAGSLTWRRLRQVLNEGNGPFWTFDTPERLRYTGAAALAVLLGLERLTGRPVILPAAALDAGIGDFKAELYKSFHAGRAKEGRRPRPVARQVITAIAGVSRHTQARYDRRAGVRVRRNLALTGRHSQEVAQEEAWQHGRASFVFDDKKGKQGETGGRYLARPLPNSYEVKNINQGPNGRQEKVNKQLALLVETREGREKARSERLFYDDGAAAGKAYNRNSRRDLFFPQRARAEVQIWHELPARPR